VIAFKNPPPIITKDLYESAIFMLYSFLFSFKDVFLLAEALLKRVVLEGGE